MLEILNNEKYHVISKHGQNTLQKFTVEPKQKILEAYPLNTPPNERKRILQKVREEYKDKKKE